MEGDCGHLDSRIYSNRGRRLVGDIFHSWHLPSSDRISRSIECISGQLDLSRRTRPLSNDFRKHSSELIGFLNLVEIFCWNLAWFSVSMDVRMSRLFARWRQLPGPLANVRVCDCWNSSNLCVVVECASCRSVRALRFLRSAETNQSFQSPSRLLPNKTGTWK